MQSKNEILIEALNKVNDWLKFAEAKNAALIAFSATIIVSILGISFSEKLFNQLHTAIYAYNLLIFMTVAMLISLISFLPQTNRFWIGKSEPIEQTINIFFFGHLALINEDQLLNIIFADKKLSSQELSIARGIANQSINNSKIALRKFRYFQVALWFTLTAILTPIVSIIIIIVFNPNWKKDVSNT